MEKIFSGFINKNEEDAMSLGGAVAVGGGCLGYKFNRSVGSKNRVVWIALSKKIRIKIFFYISEKPLEFNQVEQKYLQQIFGKLNFWKKEIGYSEYTIINTIYWFRVGNHDILKILEGQIGKYLNLKIEIL